MGVGGIGIWQLLIILLIVVLLFGTKRIKSIGSDLGNAVKGFRSAMTDSEKAAENDDEPKQLDAAQSEQPPEQPPEPGASSTGSTSSKPADKTKV